VAADILCPHQWWRNQASLISRPARKTAGKGVGDSKSPSTFCIPPERSSETPTLRANLRSVGTVVFVTRTK
jgi:hypothetical protein